MEAQELSYLKRFNREWDELLGECSRYKHKCEKLEQENRELKEKLLTAGGECGILEEKRYNPYHDDKGRFMTGGGRKAIKVKMTQKERVRVSHQIATDFPNLENDGKLRICENRNHFYTFTVNEFGSYNFIRKIRIAGNEEIISSITKNIKEGTE